MIQVVSATFEDGVLKPDEPLQLLPHARVRLAVELLQEEPQPRADGNGSADREPPVADFLGPVEYGWTEAGFEARQALRGYCEETHADH